MESQHPKIKGKEVLEANHLKDIMIHSRTHVQVDLVIYVQASRFRKILSDLRSIHGLEVEGWLDDMDKKYDFVTLSSRDIKDTNGNFYTVVKDREKEVYGKCLQCDCGKKRFINNKTGICFYKEDSADTTKIPNSNSLTLNRQDHARKERTN